MSFYPYFSEWDSDPDPELGDLDVYDLDFYPYFPEWDGDSDPELDDLYAYDDYV